jgi:hypothetical protein
MFKRTALALLLALVTLFSLYRVTAGWFFTDDFLNLEDLLQRLHGSRLGLLGPTANQFDLLRPVIRLSWLLNFSLGQFEAIGYYWFNLVVHSANVLLVFALCSLLGLGLSSAGLATFFFALAPRKLGAVLWIAGRTESLGFFFVLLALVLWAWGRKSENAKLRRWALLPLVISFGVKEWCPFYGFLLLLLIDRYLTSRWNWRELIAPFALCSGYLALIAAFHKGGRYIGTGWHVPALFLNGFGQTMMPGLSYKPWLIWGQVISLIVYPAALASGRLGRFAVAWVALALIAPSLLLHHDHVVDWNLYPAGPGMALALVCAFEGALRFSGRLLLRKKVFRLAVAGLVLALGLGQLILVHRWIETEGVPRGWKWRSYLVAGQEIPEDLGDDRQRPASERVFSWLRPR